MRIQIPHTIITIFFFLLIGCSNDSDRITNDSVYIVGYDPCTIGANYRIGYVMVSENLQDTLLAYNISDEIKKIPASVLSETNEVLYQIPEEYLQNYQNSIYFPEYARFEFRLDIEYRYTSEEEMIFNLCKGDLPSFVAPQVIVQTASK